MFIHLFQLIKGVFFGIIIGDDEFIDHCPIPLDINIYRYLKHININIHLQHFIAYSQLFKTIHKYTYCDRKEE